MFFFSKMENIYNVTLYLCSFSFCWEHNLHTHTAVECNYAHNSSSSLKGAICENFNFKKCKN